MKVIRSTSFVHEGAEGRLYHFVYPDSFPMQEGYAVCHAICQEIEKKMKEAAEVPEQAPVAPEEQ